MSTAIAAPFCAVEIYPFEGGAYQITGGQVLELTVDKNLRRMSGAFTIVLAPGGPYGPNVRPSWTEVITPLSFCLIGLRRWQYSAITMIGVVTNIAETQHWTEQGVQRAIIVSGKDFGYFFESFNWIALTFLGAVLPANAEGAGIGNIGAGAAILAGARLQGTPDQIAQDWYNKLMMGTGGVLNHTFVNWKGEQIDVGAAAAALFEPLPVEIPYAQAYITADGTWERKMRSMLNWPIYEFFVNTAPATSYAAAGGVGFSMSALGPETLATPFVVGRLNPVPQLTAQAAGGAVTLTGIDAGKWNGLTSYTPDSSFIASAVNFSEADVRNFYLFNPTWLSTMLGNQNAAQLSWVQTYGGLYDPASVHRYGYRPEYFSSEWFCDYTGSTAQQKQANIGQFGADVVARIASWYHPQPLMATAIASYPLRPDIVPGNKFTYAPFKGNVLGSVDTSTWDFYIEGVKHAYRFGGPSVTTLSLCRGLPSSIYAQQTPGGMLFDIMTGNAQRVDGSYVPGLPEGSVGGALQGWNLNNANKAAVQIMPAYATAQWVSGSAASGASG